MSLKALGCELGLGLSSLFAQAGRFGTFVRLERGWGWTMPGKIGKGAWAGRFGPIVFDVSAR